MEIKPNIVYAVEHDACNMGSRIEWFHNPEQVSKFVKNKKGFILKIWECEEKPWTDFIEEG